MNEKYPRTYHLPSSPGTTSDDRIAKDISGIYNRNIVITEKLDGENTCINKYGVFARSHVEPTRNPWAFYLQPLYQILKNELGELEVFGESLYAIHSIKYSGIESYFNIFAVRDGDTWLSWDDVEMYASILGIPTVPVLFEGSLSQQDFDNKIEELVSERSCLSSEEYPSQREGIVVRIREEFNTEGFPTSVYKWVRKGHVQTDKHWIRNWRRALLKHELDKINDREAV